MIKVTVPASTANMGPGFDTLGLALNLYNIYEFEETENGLYIEGCDDSFKNEENLVYRAFVQTACQLGRSIKGVRIKMTTNIPVSRGLGSSSACIAAGVFGANAMLKGNLTKIDLFRIAAKIEGHPDNIAPAVFGGLTASFVEDNVPYYASYEINKNLKFCALIPDFETSTQKAREMLPPNVTFKDAIFNVSRTAVLLKALEQGDINLINKSLQDKLHQRYRKLLIHEYDKVKKICFKNGSEAFFISGSGPTLMNIVKNTETGEKIKKDIKSLNYDWEIKMLEADHNGTIVHLI